MPERPLDRSVNAGFFTRQRLRKSAPAALSPAAIASDGPHMVRGFEVPADRYYLLPPGYAPQQSGTRRTRAMSTDPVCETARLDGGWQMVARKGAA